jgi:predicted ribosome quality control (RQC) complex YloA/Tae2 family protein
MEIRAELIEQHYLTDPQPVPHPQRQSHPQVHRFTTATGLEVWVGRNNHQNDWLTFKLAQDQDWWFHAQEIGGSHVVLRLPPGTLADDSDLQLAANLAAHFSQGRLSDQVPVVYTHPKHVYKPKGSRPGMVVYKHETVIWAHPNSPEVRAVLEQTRTEER